MRNQFNPGYAETKELLTLGFSKVGENVKIARNSTIIGLQNIYIGNNVRIDGFTTIIASEHGKLDIQNNVHIGTSCMLSCSKDVTLSDFTGLSHGVKIFTKTDDYSGLYMTNPTVPGRYTSQKVGNVYLGKHVIIGSNSILLPNINIGEGSAVGALSLVTKDLEEWGIFFGAPVKRIRGRSKNLLNKELDYIKESNA